MTSIEIALEILCDGCNTPLGANLSAGKVYKVYVVPCDTCRLRERAEAEDEGIETGRRLARQEASV